MFDPFTLDCDNFMGHFVLVKSLTPTTHFAFFYKTVDSPCYYHFSYSNYWSKFHFNRSTLSYCTKSVSLSLNEVTLEEKMKYWFQVLDYEEGYGPDEVSPIKVKKRRIIFTRNQF